MSPWILAARPKTLPAAVVPVALGTALAWSDGGFLGFPALVCLVFAVLIQIGANFANDYYDHQKGADTEDRIGPARAVASGWISPPAMRRAMILVFVVAFLVGCLLVPYGGPRLLLIGVLSVLGGIAYTGGPYPLGYNGLGDVFVFAFFGVVATGFTYFVQTQAWTLEVTLLSFIPGALATNLLVVNNLRDIATDRAAGKRTLAVRFGVAAGVAEYTLMWLLALGSSLALGILRGQPLWVLPWVLTALAVVHTLQLARAQGRSPGHWLGLLTKTAVALLAFGLLQIAGMLLATLFAA